MKYLIECDLTVKGSNILNVPGFRGNNEIEIDDDSIHMECEVQNSRVNLRLKKQNSKQYKLEAETEDLSTERNWVSFVESIAHALTYQINKNEVNPHYGTCYVEPLWDRYFVKPLDGSVPIIGFLNVTGIGKFKIEETELRAFQSHDVFEYYYEGVRAEQAKSKFFFWFLILEYLEHSVMYEKMFSNNRLFSDDEESQIKSLGASMKDQRKSSMILNSLRSTLKPRYVKLFELLNAIGIDEYKYLGKSTTLDMSIIKEIIETRNQLFHQSSKFDEDILWRHLFSIVRNLLITVSQKGPIFDYA